MKRLLVVGLIGMTGLGAVVWAQANAQPTTQPDQRSLDARVRAIESYLKLDGTPRDTDVTDAKTLDDVKAAMIRLERQQDLLARQVRELTQARTRESNTSDTDLKNLERELAGLRATIRDLNDRVRRMETRL